MKIEISGNNCVGCAKYTQYYARNLCTYDFEPINCGFCGRFQRTTKPGNRCHKYQEKSNVGGISRVRKEEIA